MIDLKNMKIYLLKDEAEKEAYAFIDEYYKNLPKKNDGTIDKSRFETHDNDIDALRHAYVSGVYTMEYGSLLAYLLGMANEYNIYDLIKGTLNSPEARDMDIWNNNVGREYAEKSKTRESLFLNLLNALKNGELITDVNDSKKPSVSLPNNTLEGLVVVLEESKTGENLIFLDLAKKEVLTKEEFITKIKNGKYEHYELRDIGGKETPVSKKDGTDFNNLG